MKKFDRKKRARQKAVKAIRRIINAAKELVEAETEYNKRMTSDKEGDSGGETA